MIVDDREMKSYFGGRPFDYIAYFTADPRFARIWSRYEWVADEGDFDIFKSQIITFIS